MTHYEKLATISFRGLGIVGILHSLISISQTVIAISYWNKELSYELGKLVCFGFGTDEK